MLQHLVVVTGLSGAGKSTAAHALEDLGYWCVDNLPVAMVAKLVRLAVVSGGGIDRLALVCDARDPTLSETFAAAFQKLRASCRRVDVVYLEASDSVLEARFQRSDRRHPLAREGTPLGQAIATERQLLEELRNHATELIDTSNLTVHQLRRDMVARYGKADAEPLEVGVLPYRRERGLPTEADLALDLRCATSSPLVNGVLSAFADLVSFLYPLFQREGKSYLTVGLTHGATSSSEPQPSQQLQRALNRSGVTCRIRDPLA